MTPVRAIMRLVRINSCLFGALTVFVGGYLGRQRLASWHMIALAVSTLLLIAYAQSFNDVRDRATDAGLRLDRPIATGDLSPGVAMIIAFTSAGSAIAIMGFVGIRALGAALILVASSTSYSLRLKSTVALGNLIVATTAATPLLLACLIGESLPWPVWFAFTQEATFLFCFEVLKTGRDVIADSRSGVRTLATAYGLERTLKVARIAACVTLVVPVAALVVSHGSWMYLIAWEVTVGSLLFTGLFAQPPNRSAGDVLAIALARARLAWLPGIACFLLLGERG